MRELGNESNDRWDGGFEENDGGAQIPAFLTDPIGILERRWPVMLAAVVLGLVGTIYIVAQAKLTYLSMASVLVTRQQISEDLVRSTFEDDSIANINAMVGKVLSQEKLSSLIERFDLYSSHRDLVPMSELVGRMRGSIVVEPQRSFTQRRRGESSVIYGISVENKDAELAADVANALAGLLQEASVEQRTQQARQATAFLQRTLEADEAEFRAQSQLVSEFRQKHRGALPEELQTNLRKLEIMTSRREALTSQIESAKNRLGSVGQGTTEMQIIELRGKLARESAIYTDDHPNVRAIRFQLERLEVSLAGDGQTRAQNPEFGGVLASGQNEIDSMHSQIGKIDGDMVALNVRIDQTPAIAEELTALEQKESVLRQNYLDALNKVETAELAESMEHAQQGAQVQILDPAMPSSTPKRSRRFLAFAGLMGTLFAALALAVVVEIFDPVIVAPEQLEQIVGRPVLGSLPRLA